jgi:hypothetical protein
MQSQCPRPTKACELASFREQQLQCTFGPPEDSVAPVFGSEEDIQLAWLARWQHNVYIF